MFEPASSPPRLLTLILLSALSVLSLNMFLPSLGRMADSFGVDYALMNLAISGYLVVTATLQLFLGVLSDRFGRRAVMLVAVAFFTLSTLGCIAAQDALVFLVFRLGQGAIVAGMVLSRAVVRDSYPAHRAASVLGFVAMAMAIGPLVGPIVGGVMGEFWGWRSIFWFFLAAGAVLFWLTWTDLGETNTNRSETLFRQFRDYPELLRSRRFWAYSLCLTFSVGAFYAFLGGASLVAEGRYGLSPAQVGIGLGSISGGFILGNFLSGLYSARIGIVAMMILGRIAATGGTLAALVAFLLGADNVYLLFSGAIFVGLGNGLTLPSANAGVMSVRDGLAGSASGFSGAMTVAGGAFWTWITAVLLTGTNSPQVFLFMMFLSSALGGAAALWLRGLERRGA